jgi:hypothetical protein
MCSGLSGLSATKSEDINETRAFCGTKACDYLTILRSRPPGERGGTEVFASTPEFTRTTTIVCWTERAGVGERLAPPDGAKNNFRSVITSSRIFRL